MITPPGHHRREHALLCQWARSRPTAGPFPQLQVNEDVDWAYLLATAEVHGVKELLLPALRVSASAVPPAVLEDLEQHFFGATALNLERTTQLVTLLRRLRTYGVRVLTFKGPATAIGIYGDLGLRVSTDLDLLVDRRDAQRVRPLLLNDGYELLPRARHRGGSLLYGLLPAAGRSDTLMPKDPRLASVDVHVAFAHWVQGIDLDARGLFDRAVTIDVAGEPIATLCPDDLVLVLAIHGMMHNWSHLRFVSDIQAAVRHIRKWESVVRRARAAGMRRILWVALLLGHDLLEAAVPSDVLADAKRDRGAVAMARSIAAQIFDRPAADAVDFDPAEWQLSFQDTRRGRARFHARRLIYEWFLKWPWDAWLGRRRAPGVEAPNEVPGGKRGGAARK